MHVVKLYFFLLFLFPKTSHSCGLCSTVLTRPCKLFSNAEFLSVHVYDYLSLLVLKPVGFLGATANPGKPSNPLRKRYFGWWNIQGSGSTDVILQLYLHCSTRGLGKASTWVVHKKEKHHIPFQRFLCLLLLLGNCFEPNREQFLSTLFLVHCHLHGWSGHICL